MAEVPHEAGKTSYELLDPERFFEEMGLKPGMSLLDLGCGPGGYALAAAERVGPQGRVLGLDLWPEGIETLQTEAEQRGLANLEARVADITAAELEPGERFDLVLMATVLHDLAERGQEHRALANAAGSLGRDGRLAVVEFIKKEGLPGPPLEVKLSPEEVAGLARPHGLVPAGSVDLNEFMYLALFRTEA